MALPQIKTAWGGVKSLVRYSYFCRLLSQCCLDLLRAYSCGLAVRASGRIAAWLTALWPIKVTKPAKCTSRWLAGQQAGGAKDYSSGLGMSDQAIMELNLPTGIPIVYELDQALKPTKPMRFLGDEETVRKAMEAVAAQGKAK